MKKYFIDDFMAYCYPYDVSKKVTDYGVLSEYIGKRYNRDEIDKIICELIMKHPYIEHSMWLNLSVMWEEKNTSGYYHILNLKNDNHDNQSKGNMAIKYEKEVSTMALREVAVEVTAKYITKVIAGSGLEAQEKAKNLVMIGAISPCETNAIILDVQPI